MKKQILSSLAFIALLFAERTIFAGIISATKLVRGEKTVVLLGEDHYTSAESAALQANLLGAHLRRTAPERAVVLFQGQSPFHAGAAAGTMSDDSELDVVNQLIPQLARMGFPTQNIEIRGPSIEFINLAGSFDAAMQMAVNANPVLMLAGQKAVATFAFPLFFEAMKRITPANLIADFWGNFQRVCARLHEGHALEHHIFQTMTLLHRVLAKLDGKSSLRDLLPNQAAIRRIGPLFTDLGCKLFDLNALNEILESRKPVIYVVTGCLHIQELTELLTTLGFSIKKIDATQPSRLMTVNPATGARTTATATLTTDVLRTYLVD